MNVKSDQSKSHSQSRNQNNNNLNAIKKPIYVMSIELEEGVKQDLKIYSDSKPNEIAYEFCKNNNLDFSSLQFLVNQISNLMKIFKTNNSLLNKNNNLIKNYIVPEVIREESNEETLRSILQSKEKLKIIENGNDLCCNNNKLNLKSNKKNSILSYDKFFKEMKDYLINKNKKLNQEKPKSPINFKSKIINKNILSKKKNKSQNKFTIQHNTDNNIFKIKKQKKQKKNTSDDYLSQSLLLKKNNSFFVNKSRNHTINQSFHKRNISFNKTSKNNSIKNYNHKINSNYINKKASIKKIIKTSKDNKSKNKINSKMITMSNIKGKTYENFYKNKENVTAQKLSNDIKRKLFLRIFKELNSGINEDNDIQIDKINFINLMSINIKSLNSKIYQIVIPMINELINNCNIPDDNENSNYNFIISKLRFIDYGINYMDKLSKNDKQTLVNYLDI